MLQYSFPEAFPAVLLLQRTGKFCLICLSYISNVIVINLLRIKYILKFLNKALPEITAYIAALE